MANLHFTWLPLVVIWEKCQMKNINPENNHGQPPLHLAAKLTSVVFEKLLGFIFEKPSMRNNRCKYSDKLSQPVPGHPEITSNKMAQIWNNLKLNNAKSIACVRVSALAWYRKNPKS